MTAVRKRSRKTCPGCGRKVNGRSSRNDHHRHSGALTELVSRNYVKFFDLYHDSGANEYEVRIEPPDPEPGD